MGVFQKCNHQHLFVFRFILLFEQRGIMLPRNMKQQNRPVKKLKLNTIIKSKKIIASLCFGIVICLGGFYIRTLFTKPEYVTVQILSSGGEWWWFNVNPPFWLLNSIQKGSKEYDALGRPIAEVLDVSTFDTLDGKRLSIVTAKLRVDVKKKSETFEFRNDPLFVGSSIYIAPNNIRLNGNVMWIEGIQQNTTESKILTLRDYYVYPYRADGIQVGMKMVDTQGKVMAEIIDKKVETSQMMTYDLWGVSHQQPDYLHVDLTIKVRIEATKSAGQYYFLLQPIHLGSSIAIPFATANLNEGKIVYIE